MRSAQRVRVARLSRALALILTAAVAGCAGRYGSMRYDAGVGLRFGSAQILPGYRYYTTGSESAPDAILALREDCPLRSDLWREVPMTPEKLAGLVDRMRGTRTEGPYGSAVLDDTGTRIGVWCSYLKPVPVKLLDDGGVILPPPTVETDQPPRVRGFGID